MVGSLVLDTYQRVKYRHCYRKKPEDGYKDGYDPMFFDDQLLLNTNKAR